MRLKHHILLPVLILLAGTALAAGETWVQFESDSGIFKSSFPHPLASANFTSLAVDDKRAVGSEEIMALIDQRPYKNTMKSYVIKVDQTLGPALREDEINILLERGLDLYQDFYTAYDGKIKKREIKPALGYPAGELVMSYKDPKLGEQSARIRILVTTSTRLEQVFTGPESIMSTFKTRDFFDGLTFFDGIIMNEAMLRDAWPAQRSPLGLFSLNTPPVAKPYVPQKPIIKNSQRAETITLVFRDPLRNESIYYTIYGYLFTLPLSLPNVETVLKKNYILKHKADPEKVKFTSTSDTFGRTVVDTTYDITPPEDFPFLQTVRLRATVSGQSMVIQEIMSSQPLVLSPFGDMLLKTVDFHPELYHLPSANPDTAEDKENAGRPTNEELSEKLRAAISQALQAP